MFLDESGDHNLETIDPTYPVFVLAGCIFDFENYVSITEKAVDELKLKYFGRRDIILRSYDIRKQKGDFAFLVDLHKRLEFYEDINNLVKNSDFKIIAAAIDKNKLKSQYLSPDNPYNLCLQFILERSVMYLGRTKERVIFRIESRETHNDEKLAEVYESFRNSDHNLFSQQEVQSKLVDLSFNQKVQNIAGMQIADLVAYPIGRWVIDKTRENKPFEIMEQKFHRKPRSRTYLNYGLKVFP